MRKPGWNRALIGVALCGTILCAQAPVQAEGSTPGSDMWEFEVTPYIWGVGLDGDVAVGRLSAQGVEASFSDLLDVLETAGMVSFEGRREEWGFLVDAFYADLAHSTARPEGDVEAGIVEQIYTAAGTWRASTGKAPVDIVFGARYIDLGVDLEVTSGSAQGSRRDGSVNWWDGLVGARIGWDFAEHWTLVGYGDISAGGSEFSWQAIAGVDWNFSKSFSGRFGYRYLSLDYDSSEVLYDMSMAGPYAGLAIRF